jgi:lysophospholipase L1-like esterase
MKQLAAILFFFTFSFACNKPTNMSGSAASPSFTPYHYLALGDSYTIGEMVTGPENFPNQVAAQLQITAPGFQNPRIIAKTGWTTDELTAGIAAANLADPLRSSYDFVSLLIGVNNQYRGRPADDYKPAFEQLLNKAIACAGSKTERVVVLSIPDWGVTPFALGRDRLQIAREIDAYNAANKAIALQYNVKYIDITPWTREAATDNTLLAADGLHPSGKEYRRWAEKVVEYFKTRL